MQTYSIAHLRQLSARLGTGQALAGYRGHHRLAAVLILAYPGAGEPHIVLTRRTDHLPNHAGQISFPGGSVDAADPDPVHTALREAQEEIALDGSSVEVLGVLDVAVLPSGFAVAPVLAVTEQEPLLTPNPDEVEEIFSIPLSMVSDPDRYGRDFLERDGLRREFHYLHYGEYYIWGATARMLRSLARLLEAG